METAKRSRFTAQPSGRATRATKNDEAVLALLNRYRYLPSNYIAALLGFKGEYYKDILTKLRHDAALIDCPNASWQAANARYRPAVYVLTPRGEKALKDRGLFVKHPKTGHEFYHELMVCLVKASFELGAKEHNLQIITKEEILARAPRATRFEKSPWSVPVSFVYDKHQVDTEVESDGDFFGVARVVDGGRTAILLPGFEADRATEPLEPEDYDRPSIKKKFLAYRELAKQKVYQNRYGLPAINIAFITINEAHKRALMRVVDKLTDGHGSKLFLFKSIPNFASFENFPPPTGHMVSEPWERVGHPPYNILNELKGGD